MDDKVFRVRAASQAERERADRRREPRSRHVSVSTHH
jgi:hypothetical protein